jgi:hypothetical protein
VRVRHAIAAPADRVWAAISAPGYLEDCHPFCERNPVTSWPGSGSRDEVHYLSGWVYERRFVRWIDGAGYDLEIGSRGEAASFVTWRIEPDGAGACALTITILPRPVGPAGLRRLASLVYVRPLLRRYLRSVVRGVEWFVVRGEPVTHDRFGSHPWFSART